MWTVGSISGSLLSIIHEKCFLVQIEGGTFMREFEIRLGSVQDVQDFVALATSRPFTITVRDEYNKINAQSFMELFCLNFSQPLRVVADCTEAELESLMRNAERFLVK